MQRVGEVVCGDRFFLWRSDVFSFLVWFTVDATAQELSPAANGEHSLVKAIAWLMFFGFGFTILNLLYLVLPPSSKRASSFPQVILVAANRLASLKANT